MNRVSLCGLLLALPSCSTATSDDEGSGSMDAEAGDSTISDGSEGTSAGDGDGDSGDGDSGDGDGSGGDGDGSTGDGDGSTGDGSTGDGDGSTGDGSTGDGDGEAGPTPDPDSVTLVSASMGGGIKIGHCAVTPGGDIYAIWQNDNGGNQDIWMSRSGDGGQSFESPVAIENGSLNPLGGWGAADRKPYVATDGNRVAVTFGDFPNGSSWLSLSTSLNPLTMAPLVAIGTPDTSDVEEFQKPIFRPDGNVWVAWHWTHGDPVEEDIGLSREENGWAYEVITDSGQGEPCDCCPLDIQHTGNDELLVAYRNNIGNIRDHYVLRAPGGDDFGDPIQGSSTNWETFACPTSGPRVTHTPNNGALMTWADPTAGEPRVWMAHSDDGGATWDGDHRIANPTGGFQELPSITTAGDDRVWVTFGMSGAGSMLTSSTDYGYTFTVPTTIGSTDGDLAAMELCSGGSRAGLVGVTPAGSLWWAELPVQ